MKKYIRGALNLISFPGLHLNVNCEHYMYYIPFKVVALRLTIYLEVKAYTE